MGDQNKKNDNSSFEAVRDELIESISKESGIEDTDLSVSDINEKRIEHALNNKAKSELLRNEHSINNLIDDEKFKSIAQKRILRGKLNSVIKWALFLQIIFMNILILILILSQTINFDFFMILEVNKLELFVSLLKAYIMATIVELISLLGYIIKKVFQD